MFTERSKILANNMTTVPKAVRRKLGLGPGDLFEWCELGQELVVRPIGTFSSEDIHKAIFVEMPEPVYIAMLRQGPRLQMQNRRSVRLRK